MIPADCIALDMPSALHGIPSLCDNVQGISCNAAAYVNVVTCLCDTTVTYIICHNVMAKLHVVVEHCSMQCQCYVSPWSVQASSSDACCFVSSHLRPFLSSTFQSNKAGPCCIIISCRALLCQPASCVQSGASECGFTDTSAECNDTGACRWTTLVL